MAKENKNKKILVLLDVHAILHRAYHALPDFVSKKGEPTGGLYGLSAMLIKIIRELKPDYIAACYDLPEPTFRHEAYKEYKKGRAKAQDDLIHQIKRSRDIFEAFNIPIYDKPGFEADDLLGTIAEQVKKQKDIKTIIASGDMDTLQLVEGDSVVVYTLKKGINDTIIYDEKGVEERFGFSPELLIDYKGLRGDPSDNIIGIAGIGEKTATTLLQKFGKLEDIYKKLKKDEEAFVNAGIKPRMINLLKEGEEEAIFSKTLATIKRDVPIEFFLPEKKWQESFEPEKTEKLFAELDFRRLRERVREISGGEAKTQEEWSRPDLDHLDNKEDLKKAQIALWLINSDITNPDLEDILEYTGKSTLEESLPVLLGVVEKNGLQKVLNDVELPIVPIIEEAQNTGVLVDTPYLKKLSKEYHKKLASLESKIWKLAGGEFNINSPKQMGEVLFDKMGLSTKGLKKTAGGSRSTRESELVKLKDEHEIIKHILAYRELQKLLSTYIDNIPQMVGLPAPSGERQAGKDDRLHTTLNQTGTTTGRMSSTNPNMQNIPARDGLGKAIRNAFVAEKGHSFVAFDYSQIEMRILAVLAKDEKLTKVFKDGKDVHSSVASFVFGVPEDKVSKDMRRKAKVINFGIIYGMGVNSLKANLGGTRAEAQEFYDNYFKAFPKIAAYFDGVKKDANKKGFTETMFGRRRYFKGIKSSIPYIRSMAERMAINAPIQGTAADVIKIAMKKADEKLKTEGLADKAHLLLQIH
ncbi:DNA polymerase I, partial [hydrothermal vent metagenome]